ncbi:class II glutamine amidotransferase [Candidatus Bipolaricaulota bacterium]|nr:class II glutamine amidotransferase [Candidatus Bipolaricaulota bacterium]
MIAAPPGISGELLINPFVRMAQGLNAINEHNKELGTFTHGHGWGAIVADGSEDKAIRSVRACWDNEAIDTLRHQTIYFLHARLASKGAVALGNVHPFDAVVNGKQWSYCHNGTVRQPLETPSSLNRSDSTDSEKVFHQLLRHIEKGQVLEGIRATYGAIDDFTSLNSFLLGPEALWVVCLYTEMPDYYTLYLSATEFGPVISSEILAELDTQPVALSNGEILRIDRTSGHVDSFRMEEL